MHPANDTRRSWPILLPRFDKHSSQRFRPICDWVGASFNMFQLDVCSGKRIALEIVWNCVGEHLNKDHADLCSIRSISGTWTLPALGVSPAIACVSNLLMQQHQVTITCSLVPFHTLPCPTGWDTTGSVVANVFGDPWLLLNQASVQQLRGEDGWVGYNLVCCESVGVGLRFEIFWD